MQLNWDNEKINEIVENIKNGDGQIGWRELTKVFYSPDYRFMVFGIIKSYQEVDDVIADAMIASFKALKITTFRVLCWETVLKLLVVITRRTAYKQVEEYVMRRAKVTSFDGLEGVISSNHYMRDSYDKIYEQEKINLANDSLAKLKPKDREVLIRFYCLDEKRDEIMSKMDLTETSYRLLKCRAIGKLRVLVQTKIKQNDISKRVNSL